jgi:hypothetical protein
MYRPKFCAECGVPIGHSGWRGGRFCEGCRPRLRRKLVNQAVVAGAAVLLFGFAFGRYFRPSPPPLVIERTANSPLSDLPVNLVNADALRRRTGQTNNSDSPSGAPVAENYSRVRANGADFTGDYICGARTKKGTPCRHRVHTAGDRCSQHKGQPAMLPLEKLAVKDQP